MFVKKQHRVPIVNFQEQEIGPKQGLESGLKAAVENAAQIYKTSFVLIKEQFTSGVCPKILGWLC